MKKGNMLILALSMMSCAAYAAKQPAMSANASAQKMTQAHLEEIIRAESTKAQGGKGVLRFVYGGVLMVCISDVTHDRMRIVAPVIETTKLNASEIFAMLEADFDRALDARYAVNKGTVYSVFIHPLSPLQKSELESALRQVATAAKNFGTSYASSNLMFGGGQK